MLQTIPLAPALRIHVHLIVQRLEPQRCQVQDFLLERLAPEPGELHVVQRPVQLDALARLDFRAGCAHAVGSQEVERAQLVRAAPNAPGAALRLGGDGWERVEGGVGVRVGGGGGGEVRGEGREARGRGGEGGLLGRWRLGVGHGGEGLGRWHGFGSRSGDASSMAQGTIYRRLEKKQRRQGQ